MVNTFLSTFLLASVTIASPAPAAPAGHAYKAPGPNDVRSPCPGLNSLANHGFIHRNGKGMTIPHLIKGGKEGMNIGADFMIAIGGAGDLSNPNPLEGNFDLDHLKEHDFPIEHDGSLSRSDKYFSRNNWFDLKEKPYNQWMSVFGDAKKTSIKTASNARYTRISDSLKRNPNVSYGPRGKLYPPITSSLSPRLTCPLNRIHPLLRRNRPLPPNNGHVDHLRRRPPRLRRIPLQGRASPLRDGLVSTRQRRHFGYSGCYGAEAERGEQGDDPGGVAFDYGGGF